MQTSQKKTKYQKSLFYDIFAQKIFFNEKKLFYMDLYKFRNAKDNTKALGVTTF